MDLWLVINDKSLSYSDRYRLFWDKDSALIHATSIGYKQLYIPFDDSVGLMNHHADGDADVGIVRLEVSRE